MFVRHIEVKGRAAPAPPGPLLAVPELIDVKVQGLRQRLKGSLVARGRVITHGRGATSRCD